MIETLNEYIEQRYKPLESALIDRTAEHLSRELPNITTYCLNQWRQAIKSACEIQSAAPHDCAYMSISLLNTSMLDNKPTLQIDFYDEEWVYGESWARSRMSADFLFKYWSQFTIDALDDKFYTRSRLRRVEMKALFWGTIEKLAYLFTCYAKYFAPHLSYSDEFDDLVKMERFYITCGTYLDWQERLYGQLPEIDFLNLDANEETRFREINRKVFRNEHFNDIQMQHCRIIDCWFDNFNFDNINLCDAIFLRCRFTNVIFNNVKVAGTDFMECYFKDCQFINCSSNPADAAVENDEYFAPMRFYFCYFINQVDTDCDFAQMNKIKCVEKN